MTVIIIRKMQPNDLDWVIKSSLSSQEIDTGTDSPQTYSEQSLNSAIQSKDNVMLVAETDTEKVGFVISSILRALADLYVHEIWVDPERRRQGIAKKLLDETLKRAKLSCPRLDHPFTLIKTNNEPVRKLLISNGFTISTETFNYSDKMI